MGKEEGGGENKGEREGEGKKKGEPEKKEKKGRKRKRGKMGGEKKKKKEGKKKPKKKKKERKKKKEGGMEKEQRVISESVARVHDGQGRAGGAAAGQPRHPAVPLRLPGGMPRRVPRLRRELGWRVARMGCGSGVRATRARRPGIPAPTRWGRPRPVAGSTRARRFLGVPTNPAGAEAMRQMDRYEIPARRLDVGVPPVPARHLRPALAVKVYCEAYKLTGDAHYLAQARYWAWSGLPFIYTWSLPATPRCEIRWW